MRGNQQLRRAGAIDGDAVDMGVAGKLGERLGLPDVASGKGEAEPAERISPEEQRRLDRLIEEKLREE